MGKDIHFISQEGSSPRNLAILISSLTTFVLRSQHNNFRSPNDNTYRINPMGFKVVAFVVFDSADGRVLKNTFLCLCARAFVSFPALFDFSSRIRIQCTFVLMSIILYSAKINCHYPCHHAQINIHNVTSNPVSVQHCHYKLYHTA